jgi:hypothetical protein
VDVTDAKQYGMLLRRDLDEEYARLKAIHALNPNSETGNNISFILTKYIKKGNLITNTIDILKFAGFQFGDDNGSRAKTNSEEHYLYCGLTIEKIFLGEAKIYVVIYSEEGASKPSSTVSNITGKISVDTV